METTLTDWQGSKALFLYRMFDTNLTKWKFGEIFEYFNVTKHIEGVDICYIINLSFLGSKYF